MKSIILFGAGKHGEWLKKQYADEVEYFCDNKRAGEIKCGIPVISVEELIKIHDKYRIIIALEFSQTTLDVKRQLMALGIESEASFYLEKCLKVCRRDEKWEFVYEDKIMREFIKKRLMYGTIPMLKETMDRYGHDLHGDVTFYIYGGDYASEADECRKVLGIHRILAYSTTGVLSHRVIAIPDYKFYYSSYFEPDKTDDCDMLFDAIRREGEKPFEDSRAMWCGNVTNSDARYNLMVMGERYPEKIYIRPYFDTAFGFSYGKEKFMHMSEFMNYKYLVDIRGWGWTDRVKLLLAMGRPLLLVERPYKEYYFEWLKPMVHYIPIKEDMSDLIQQIDDLDNDEGLYKEIVENARRFTIEHFSNERVLSDLFESVKLVCNE